MPAKPVRPPRPLFVKPWLRKSAERFARAPFLMALMRSFSRLVFLNIPIALLPRLPINDFIAGLASRDRFGREVRTPRERAFLGCLFGTPNLALRLPPCEPRKYFGVPVGPNALSLRLRRL